MAFTSVFMLSSCKKNMGAGEIFRYDLSSSISSIDPQYTKGREEAVIIANTMEGLFISDENGQPVLCSALSYNISPDGTVYTFKLDENKKWSNGESVTAADFEFAFKRMFGLNAMSPNADTFISMKNAAAILNGEMDTDELGINSVDKFTLKIELEAPNPYFIELLILPAAVPCNKAFLESCKGRYGLTGENMIYNGAFSVTKWTDEYIQVRQNKHYYSDKPTIAGGVNFYFKRGNSTDLFNEEKSDCTILTTQQYSNIGNSKFITSSMDNVVWALTYNQKNSYFSNINIRTAFSSAIETSNIDLGELVGFSNSENFIPKNISIGEKIYRETAGNLNYNHLYTTPPINTLNLGLEELGISKSPKLTLLLPDNAMGKKIAVELQKVLASKISVYINLEYVSEELISSRIISGSYDLAVAPYYLESSSPLSMLSYFSSTGKNYIGYTSQEFDTMLYAAMHSQSISKSINLIYGAEQTLINDSVIYPLYDGSVVFIMAQGVDNILVSDFNGICYFKYATKK